MVKKLNHSIIYLLVLIIVLSSLSSCSSIYGDNHDVSGKTTMEIDPSEEYFTSGSAVSKQENGGKFYNDTWIYVEKQSYQQYITTYNGERKYTPKSISRFVKMNPHTGEVSSLCLTPTCTHGPDSGCPMISPENATPLLQGLTGDWLVFSYYIYETDALQFVPESYIYNIKTGELIQLVEYDISQAIISRLSSWCFFENKVYYTKQILDYTNSGYLAGNIKTLEDYSPETRVYLCEYDINTKKTTEVMEVENDYIIAAITNRRYFFIKDKSNVYSCSHSGDNWVEEDILDFSPQAFCGIYGYYFDHTNREILIYDIRANKKTVIPMEYSYQYTLLTNDGIIFSTFNTADESYAELLSNKNKLNDNDFVAATTKHRYEATSQIYLMGFNGQGKEIVYEGDGMILDAYYKSGKYLYCIVGFPDPNNGYKCKSVVNDGRSVINIETGEITPIPLLELIIPEEYK